jgi:hypothetical protein
MERAIGGGFSFRVLREVVCYGPHDAPWYVVCIAAPSNSAILPRVYVTPRHCAAIRSGCHRGACLLHGRRCELRQDIDLYLSDLNRWIQSRKPSDMTVHGCASNLFQPSQQ